MRSTKTDTREIITINSRSRIIIELNIHFLLLICLNMEISVYYTLIGVIKSW